MNTETLPTHRDKPRSLIILLLLAAIIGLGAFLRFYQLGQAGVGNTYYAAAVKSMLQSWHNFFYVSFEPGGSVSVDKPPLGFWVQTISAYFLGLNGFALALPNALAGLGSIFLLYHLVRRPFGPWIGLAAALALAITPVAVSAERNNTIDGMLVFVLLLSAWAFLQSVYTRKPGWIFLGAFLVGLGFNIKMLQAFLPLPAFYALYLFAAKHKWWQKLLHLGAATALLLIVSFSWAFVVDLTPPEQRPYVGGSENNSVMELIFGHNGISRLLGAGMNRIRDDSGPFPGGAKRPPLPQPPSQFPSQGQKPPGQRPPLQPGQNPPNQPGMMGQKPTDGAQPSSSGSHPVMDVGTPGTLRLFREPLVGEIGWLLPFVLAGLPVILIVLGVKRPLSEQHAALILWAGWLIPEAIYFTYSQGIMHAYYMIMLGAPVAALFAMTGWALWKIIREQTRLGWGLLIVLALGTLAFQIATLWGCTAAGTWVAGVGVILSGAVLLIAVSISKPRIASFAPCLMLAAVLVAPAIWSALTTFNPTPHGGLPYAGPSRDGNRFPQGQGQVDQQLLDYLLENTGPETYLLAVDTANQAAPFILETGRAVFTFGGFGGMDNIVDADGLAAMVAAGELRFVLGQGLQGRPEITAWLKANCKVTQVRGQPKPANPWPDSTQQGGQALYDCGGSG